MAGSSDTLDNRLVSPHCYTTTNNNYKGAGKHLNELLWIKYQEGKKAFARLKCLMLLWG